jgi:flavin reductase (DIM6/NTAB) family NADH-FMN oxidoreductase RutF/DNA-binding IclR family transcriptional regulator
MNAVTDSRWFREVLGQYPTGVCVVTATQDDGVHAGFVVGSFTSVSLDPPLVAFFPDKKSTSWPKIEAAQHFCVNILSADQEHLCRRFASKADDKFQGVAVRQSVTGAPIIEDVVAWIDCELESVTEAGDHYIVIGRVVELGVENPSLPLLFFQGGYGRFSPLSLAAPSDRGALPEQLREVDIVRSEMERLADDLECRCVATIPVDDDIVVVASAGSTGAGARATLVGVRMPSVRPYASSFAAWFDDAKTAAWLEPLGDEAVRQKQLRRMRTVRERGYSIGLLNDAQRTFASALNRIAEDPHASDAQSLRSVVTQLDFDPEEFPAEAKDAVRVIAAPVFRGDGDVALVLTVYGFSRPDLKGGIERYITRLLEATGHATELLSQHEHSNA